MAPLVTNGAISYLLGQAISLVITDFGHCQISHTKNLPLVVYITPDEIQDTYVKINDDMLFNANNCSALIQKSKQ